ncbi:MAG: hypothetical protein OWQ57_08470 [Sulfobacillus sp.]|nr:hypothetical protein [Sulfobacillus sp.]
MIVVASVVIWSVIGVLAFRPHRVTVPPMRDVVIQRSTRRPSPASQAAQRGALALTAVEPLALPAGPLPLPPAVDR